MTHIEMGEVFTMHANALNEAAIERRPLTLVFFDTNGYGLTGHFPVSYSTSDPRP